MVDKIEAPDPPTVVFRLKFATSAFIPALADPYHLDLQKGDPRQGPALVRKKYHGLGPVQVRRATRPANRSRASATRITITRDCRISTTLPASLAPKQATRRRRDPRRPSRDRVPRFSARGARRTGRLARRQDHSADQRLELRADRTPNHQRKPFDDVRVRRALTLAIDRWRGAPALSKIAIMRTVGGIVFPGSPLAATKEELQQIAGYWPDIEKSRAEARRLLEGGRRRGPRFELLNRNVDQPFKYLATWLVDQWSKMGLKVTQRVARPARGSRRCAAAISTSLSRVTAKASSIRCSTSANTSRRRSSPSSTEDSTTRRRSTSIKRCCTRPTRQNSAS